AKSSSRAAIVQLVNNRDGTILQLARQLQFTKGRIRSWMRGMCMPSWDSLCDISFCFKIPLADILTNNLAAFSKKIYQSPFARPSKARRAASARDWRAVSNFLNQVQRGQYRDLTSVFRVAQY